MLTRRYIYDRTFITAEKGRGSSEHDHLSDAASFPQKWEVCSLTGDETELLPHDPGKHSIPDCTEERQALLPETDRCGVEIPAGFNFCVTRPEIYHAEEGRTAARQHRGDRKNHRRSDENCIKTLGYVCLGLSWLQWRAQLEQQQFEQLQQQYRLAPRAILHIRLLRLRLWQRDLSIKNRGDIIHRFRLEA